jgi:hypothetical protein
MTAAEAAQQALRTSGKLAEQAQGSLTLKDILVTYGDVQRLCHKAMLPHVQRHQQLSGTPAGLAYAMLCDVLAQPMAKQLGDQITSIELQQLVEKVQQLPSMQAQKPVALLAVQVAVTLQTWREELSTIDMCVMQDVVSMLAGDPEETLPQEAASTAGGLSGLWESAMSKAGQLVLNAAGSAVDALRKSVTENALLLACKPPGSPLEFYPGFMLTMKHGSTVQWYDS